MTPEDRPKRFVPLLWAFAIASAVTLAYSLYTDHTWEDFFITFRFSRNLSDGAGLVYQPGERVHGFTSPLGVLLPSLGYRLAGSSSYVPALWVFRGISILAFALGSILLIKAMPQRGYLAWSPFFLAALYALDAKSVAFSTNGMETGLVLFFFAWAILLLHPGSSRASWWRGVAWAGLLWTRPDGCVYIGALGLAGWIFSSDSRFDKARRLLRSSVACAVLYLPWFAWAWYYYGSPVPNTIRAKAPPDYVQYLSESLQNFPQHYYERACALYSPIYYFVFGGWPAWFGWLSAGLSLFCSLYWLLPTNDRFGRSLSLCFAVLSLYTLAISELYPWYIPPLAMCATVVIVCALTHLLAVIEERYPGGARTAKWAGVAGLSALTAWLAWMLWGTVVQMRTQQDVIEAHHRENIGQWLRERVKRDERVYVECLGYIGYFSNAHMLDWPGLVSPSVVELRREQGLDLYTVVPALHPEWLVLRPRDAEVMMRQPYCGQHYRLVQVFDARSELDKYPDLHGRAYLSIDSVFLIFQKIAATPQ
jgi:hypothetical protein